MGFIFSEAMSGLGELAVVGREYTTGQRYNPSLIVPTGYMWVPSRIYMGVPMLWKIQWIAGYGAQKVSRTAAGAEAMPSGWVPSSSILERLKRYQKGGAPQQSIPSRPSGSVIQPGSSNIIYPAAPGAALPQSAAEQKGISPVIIIGGLAALGVGVYFLSRKKKRRK